MEQFADIRVDRVNIQFHNTHFRICQFTSYIIKHLLPVLLLFYFRGYFEVTSYEQVCYLSAA